MANLFYPWNVLTLFKTAPEIPLLKTNTILFLIALHLTEISETHHMHHNTYFKHTMLRISSSRIALKS